MTRRLTILWPLFTFLVLTTNVGCRPVIHGLAEPVPAGDNREDRSFDASIDFVGLTHFTHLTDSTVLLHWSAHPAAVAYELYLANGDTLSIVASVVGQGQSNLALGNLTPDTNYTFLLRLQTAGGKIDTNQQQLTLTTNSAPASPSELSLVNPDSSSDYLRTPTIKVSGVKVGDLIELHRASDCSNKVGEQTALGSEVNITTTMPLAPGSYQFYAKSKNRANNYSPCSSAFVNYTLFSNFAGVTSAAGITDSTATLHWTPHADAIFYLVYQVAGETLLYHRYMEGAASSSVELTGLTPSTSYTFRVLMQTTTGIEANTVNTIFTTNAAPNAPTGLSLVNPVASPGFEPRPTMRVAGVKTADVIKLFRDSSCNSEVASGIASGGSIDLTLNSDLTSGNYTFYANATNPRLGGSASSCSTALVNYTKSICPTGYLLVPPNPEVGTTQGFCVAKYEMKFNSGPKSEAAGTPWMNHNQIFAKAACASIGTNYHLITNPQWMTIARNIEQIDSNWHGAKGTGVLARGHSDANPNDALAVSNPSDDYDGTGNDSNSGWEQRRTHTLSNGEIIWDFAGNARELVDWYVAPSEKAQSSYYWDPGWFPIEFLYLDTNIGSNDPMATNTWQSSFLFTDSVNGIGKYYVGWDDSGGAAVRGGSWSDADNSGVFALMLGGDATYSWADFGFRCAWLP